MASLWLMPAHSSGLAIDPRHRSIFLGVFWLSEMFILIIMLIKIKENLNQINLMCVLFFILSARNFEVDNQEIARITFV